jgi:hypothetical protein
MSTILALGPCLSLEDLVESDLPWIRHQSSLEVKYSVYTQIAIKEAFLLPVREGEMLSGHAIIPIFLI